jgi:hypothetical protein
LKRSFSPGVNARPSRATLLRRAQGPRERVRGADLRLGGLAGVQRGGLGRLDRLVVGLDVAGHRDLAQAAARPLAHGRAPAARRDAVDRGLHDDAQQGVAVQALGEGLADAPDRLLQALALELELIQARLQLARHRVELAAELGELIVALRGHLDGEVAHPKGTRGLEQALDLGVQRPRHGQRKRECEDEEADQRRADQQRRRLEARADRALVGEHPHGLGLRVEAGRLEAGHTVLAALELNRPAQRHAFGLGPLDGRAERDVADADDRVQQRHAGHQLGVLLRQHGRDREVADRLLPRVDQAAARGSDRGLVTDLEAALTVEPQHHALGLHLGGQLGEALLDRRPVLVADCPGEGLVAADRARRLLPAVLELAEQTLGSPLRLGQPRVALAVRGVRDEPEEHERDRDHRHDHDDDEEESEAIAKAHAAFRAARPA